MSPPDDDKSRMVAAALQGLSENVRDLWVPSTRKVRRLYRPPSGDAFLREYVRHSTPVVVQGAMATWPALRKWDDLQYLAARCGDADVSVNVTPDGYADAVKPCREAVRAQSDPLRSRAPRIFVKPEERRMTADYIHSGLAGGLEATPQFKD